MLSDLSELGEWELMLECMSQYVMTPYLLVKIHSRNNSLLLIVSASWDS